jgi:hypothetical protein
VTYDGIQDMAYLDMVVSGLLIEAGCIIIWWLGKVKCFHKCGNP